MLQYKIPQNVGIEDKIVGPFSLRQLIILAVGGGISYTIFAISSRIYELNFVEYFLMALPALFAVAAAMLKIHNVTFAKYLMLMVEFAIKPKKRMWDHRGISALVAPDLMKKAPEKQAEKTTEKGRQNVNLSQLSAMLDSGGFEHVSAMKHEDIDKVNDDDLITEAYFGHKKKESSTQNMYWRTREVQKKKLDLLAKIKTPAKPEAAAPPAPAPAKAPVLPDTKEARKETVTEQLAKVITKARNETEEEKKLPAKPKPVPPPPSPAPKAPSPPPAPSTPPPSPAPATPAMNEAQKKKRKRRKKTPKPTPPARPAQPVNTIVRSASSTQPQPEKNKNETSFSDLAQGGEIEFNLD